MTEHEMREIFREMREEPVPADSLVRVRAGVEERVGKRRWWRVFVPALGAAGCILAVFLLLKPVKTAAPPVKETAQASALPEIADSRPETPVRTVPRRARLRASHAAIAPVSIWIETPDPEVVILLVN